MHTVPAARQGGRDYQAGTEGTHPDGIVHSGAGLYQQLGNVQVAMVRGDMERRVAGLRQRGKARGC